jgi:hypothetical protein
MTREECTAAWYRRQGPVPAPAAQPASGANRVEVGRQPKFVTPGGISVQAISLDGTAQYQIKNGTYLVAYASDLTEVAQYVDLTELEEEKTP